MEERPELRVRIDRTLKAKLERLALKERRSLSMMTEVLVAEGIWRRAESEDAGQG